jgi:hypothetical protein
MKKQKLLIIFLMSVAGATLANARHLAFIDATFDDFVARCVTDEVAQKEFRIYFSNLVGKLQDTKKSDPQKEKAMYLYLYDLALKNLPSKHSDWYAELKPFVADPRYTLNDDLDEVRGLIKGFLTRYGAYEAYLDFKARAEGQVRVADNEGLWHTFKGYCSKFATKLSSLLGFESNKTI